MRGGTLQVEQRIGLAVGARLTIIFTPRMDLVTGASYSPGHAVLHGAGRRFHVTAGNHLLTGTADARYWLSPPGRRLSWQVHTGVGFVFGGEPAYQDLFESSTVSGLVGTAVRYQISRLVALKVGLRNRLYRIHLGHLNGGSFLWPRPSISPPGSLSTPSTSASRAARGIYRVASTSLLMSSSKILRP
jgi:hypothetical protein